MKYILPLLLLSCFSIFGCTDYKDQIPEKGVSFALNEHRKKSIQGIQYAIELNIPEAKHDSITGLEIVTFQLDNTDSALVLDFSGAAKNLLSVKSAGKDVDYIFENEHIVVDPKFLKKGENRLEIRFIAGDMSLNRSDEYLYTLFVPDRASTCFPLFDQPNLKAEYELTLKVPAGWEAVSNGALKNRVSESGKVVYHFEKTKPVSSYLFAFATGKFFKTSKTVGGRAMTMYYRETDSVKVNRNRDEVFELHAKSVTWLEKYTGIPYPFGKFDFVLIPSFQYGGMEHPGSIFYNESALFLDENASVNKRMARASVIAHESAHMWFGDLVTMDWFNDVWLKEVFANFMAAKIVHPSFPEINHELRFLLAHYPAAYEVDRSSGTNPILQPLGNLKNAGTLYGAIIYQKAPIVMRQLERKIGEKVMQASLADYLKKYAFGNAKWDDLISIMDQKTPLNLTEWSNVWVKTPDMPEYEMASAGGNLRVIQQSDTLSKRIWQQPVTFKWLHGNRFRDTTVLFSDAGSREIEAGISSLVFPNADGRAYGYFKMDTAAQRYFVENFNNKSDLVLSDPVFRGAMLVNQWESFVRGNGVSASEFTDQVFGMLENEENPLLVDFLLANLQSAWWKFLTDPVRKEKQGKAEIMLWKLLNDTKDKGIKTSYFRTFKSLAASTDGLKKMRGLWDGDIVVKDLVLSEEDHISLAYEIALKGLDGNEVLQKQLSQTKNPDRRARMQFVIPALSSSEAERDAFFESLKKPENREKEAWVLDGLSYLHHPLRQKSALKYLRPSLYMLQEIQLTGDIFFPTRWTQTTFSGHSSKEAAGIADAFLKENENYPYYLKNKILQATDMLDRAVKMKE
jgi:aminopeptidase N